MEGGSRWRPSRLDTLRGCCGFRSPSTPLRGDCSWAGCPGSAFATDELLLLLSRISVHVDDLAVSAARLGACEAVADIVRALATLVAVFADVSLPLALLKQQRVASRARPLRLLRQALGPWAGSTCSHAVRLGIYFGSGTVTRLRRAKANTRVCETPISTCTYIQTLMENLEGFPVSKINSEATFLL